MADRRLRGALLPALASTVLTLAAIEIGFRTYAALAPDPLPLPLEVYPENPRGYFKPCGVDRYCPKSDRSAYGCDAPVEPGRGQVLIVGDSFAWGQGVNPEDTFSSRIDFPRHQRRNCAVPGRDLMQIREDFRRQRARYRPSLAIYAMVLNDLGIVNDAGNPFNRVGGPQWIQDYINFRNMNLQSYVDSKRDSSPLLKLALRSRTVAYFYRRWIVHRVGQLTIRGYRNAFAPGPLREQAFAAVEEMARASDRFMVVLFPLFVDLGHYPFEDIHRSIREQLRRRGIEVLDLLDTFRGMDESKLTVYRTDQHPNEIAHRLAAEALRARLQQLGWPPFAP